MALFVNGSLAQTDSLWTRSYGGPGIEAAGTMSTNNLGNNMSGIAIDKVDNGIYVTTYTNQAGGWINNNFGSDDIWLIKLNQNGDTLWTRVLGGTGTERSYKVRAVSAGGCILAGRSDSNSGLFAGNFGQTDGILIRVDANGNVLWSKCYGGSEQDYLYDVVENPAGNFVACGETGSNDGNLAGTGSGLAWVLFVNGTNGNFSQSVCPEGPNSSSPGFLENFTVIKRLNDDSGYVLGGFTSPDFNNFNQDDIWILKLTFSGQVLWSKKYGSTNARDGLGALVDLGNNQLFAVGMLGGNGGYPNYGGGPADGFLLKIDAANGDTVFTKLYGGTDWEYFNDAIADNQGNTYMAGFSRSTNGFFTGLPNFGLADNLVVKINNAGDTIYTLKYGGSDFDALLSIAGNGTPDEFAVCGRTNSNNGWITGNNGNRDIHVAKFENITTSIEKNIEFSYDIFPNPSNGNLYININSTENSVFAEWFDLTGKKVIAYNLKNGINQCDLNHLPKGFYFCTIKSGQNQVAKKVILH